ncbi:MAG TPA: N,N-dimethylformamidase beta subunit family domain-containing protein, partial [Ktedonobacterales bacterium]|nr:N,N-dimethylformamidase beta subunit family domain-containing protein [Ktedonobacterales bacterium]
CGSCAIDVATHLVDAHWRSSYMLHIGADWLSGVYLIKLIANNQSMSYIPLVVRDDMAHSAALAMIAVNTYQAYNLWGGYDLYGNVVGRSGLRATKVSFNRPYARSAGAGDLLYWDIQSIRWMERLGLDVRYATDVDVSTDPASLLQHQMVLTLGHHEYWTAAMRDGLTAARDHGVSLAFLGANDGYWQVRYEPDRQGHANRVVVCYKVATHATDPTMRLSLDPMYAINRHLVTAQFRDPVIGEPENALIGIMYQSITRTNDDPDWVVADGNSDPFAHDAALTAGEHIKGGLVGYEYDGGSANGAQPSDLVVLGASPLINRYGKRQTALTTYYRADSGALVFAAGTIWWSWGLDAFTWSTDYFSANRLRGNAHISALTASLIRAMLAASPPH